MLHCKQNGSDRRDYQGKRSKTFEAASSFVGLMNRIQYALFCLMSNVLLWLYDIIDIVIGHTMTHERKIAAIFSSVNDDVYCYWIIVVATCHAVNSTT